MLNYISYGDGAERTYRGQRLRALLPFADRRGESLEMKFDCGQNETIVLKGKSAWQP